MKQRATLLWALASITVGAIGLIVIFAVGGGSSPLGGFSSNGQRIYYTGTDETGAIPRAGAGFGMMGGTACVDCHGEDGRGGLVGMMYGTVDVPDIRYSTLSRVRSEDGTFIPEWSDADIARAIRDGVEPDGKRLRTPMPRWEMTDADLTDVIAYLKELSAR